MRALKPNSAAAFDGSRERRGCPFGIEVSHLISPLNPVAAATMAAVSLDRRFDPGAEVDRVGLVVAFRCQDQPLDAVVDVEVLARRCSVAPQDDLVVGESIIFRIRAGITWELCEVEVVARARRGSSAAGRSC